VRTITAEIDVPATFVAIAREEVSRGNMAFR
jgi:hypothetical protein